MKDKLVNYLRAGNAGLGINSYENQRVEGEVAAAAAAAGFEFYSWTATRGVVHIQPPVATVLGQDQNIRPDFDALAKFDAIRKDQKAVLLLHDFDVWLNQGDPMFIRKIKDSLLAGKMCSHSLIMLGCALTLPPQLEKEISMIEFKLPDRDQLLAVAKNIAKSVGVELNGNTDALLDAASGLTSIEAEDAMSLAAVEAGGKDIPSAVVAREKAETVKKNGILEVIERSVSAEEIGGLENLKADLHSKRNLFTKAALEYGLDSPRGILVCGSAGTGKSLTAAATKTIFSLPLVRIEAGRIFGGTVGESERNWRSAFATVKAIAPVVCWIDEADSLFGGAESSGKCDGGTTSRVVKAVLQDMQFNGAGIFFVFTANDIDAFPDPLIDRLDVWSVDLPNHTERKAIWSIHIAKRKRKPSKFPVEAFAEASDGFSGRQIEQVWLKAMTVAFNDGGREPCQADVLDCLKATVPTSKLMAEQIERRRVRLLNRAQPASAKESLPVVVSGRKLVAVA